MYILSPVLSTILLQSNDIKKGFTLIELLVVIAIVGLLAGATLTTLRSGVEKAKATTIIQDLSAIQRAFELKALDEEIAEWWHEDEFPNGRAQWETYVSLAIDEEIIDDFLPIASDPPEFAGDIEANAYFYDNDKDWSDPHVFINPSDCNVETEANRRNNWDGVNVQFDIGVSYEDELWWTVANHLDEAFDEGDGLYCGRFRADSFVQSRFFYSIDFDQEPNF